MLYIDKYDKNSLAALTYKKEKQFYDDFIGKVITVGLSCGVMHTGVLVATLSDGIKLFLLYPPHKGKHPFKRCTYEYIFYRDVAFVITSFA